MRSKDRSEYELSARVSPRGDTSGDTSSTRAGGTGARAPKVWSSTRPPGQPAGILWRAAATVRSNHDPSSEAPSRGVSKGGTKHGTLLDPSVLALPFVCLCTTPGISKSKTKANWGRRSNPRFSRQLPPTPLKSEQTMAAPRRRPAKLRLLGGTGPGRDSGGRRVAAPLPFRRMPPEQPSDLTPAAAELWASIVEELGRLDLLRPLDSAALVMACEAWATWKSAHGVVVREGVVGENSQGRVVHPALKAALDASREFRAWSACFGLSPSDADRIGANIKAAPGDNPFAPREPS